MADSGSGGADLSRLIHLVYDAATEPDRWPMVLEAIRDKLDGATAALNVHDVETKKGRFSQVARMDPDFARRYDEHYAGINAWANEAGRSLLTPGRIVTGDEMLPLPDLKRTEYYCDFLEPIGVDGLLAVILAVDEQQFVGLNVGRRRGRAWSRTQMRLFRELAPHVQRAFQIRNRLERLETERDASLESLERLDVGVIIVRDDGRTIAVNRAARDIVGEKDGISIDRGGLRAARHDVTLALRACVKGALATSAGRGSSAGGTLRLPRPSLKRPLTALVTPLRAGFLGFEPQRGLAAVFLGDPERQLAPPIDSLRHCYGLTRAEASVTAQLLQGHSLETSAAHLEIRLGTARTHLKRILGKTGARRQSELMLLLLKALVPVRFP